MAKADFLYTYNLTNGEVNLLGPWSGQLSDRGERIALENPQAADLPATAVSWVIIDEAICFDAAPWPTGADGTGGSLSRKPSIGSGNDPVMWQLSGSSSGKKTPTVAISYPLNHTELQIPFSIIIHADVNNSQISGSLHKIEFWLDDTTKFGETSTEPYEATLDYHTITTAGTNAIKVILIDDAGSHAYPVVELISTIMTNRVWITHPDNGE